MQHKKDHSHSACRSGGGILRDKRSGFEAAAEGDQPTFLASLLYFGAGIGIGLLYCINPKSHRGEKKLTRKDLPYTLGMILLDIAAPILLMLGLKVHLPPTPLCWEILKSLPLR